MQILPLGTRQESLHALPMKLVVGLLISLSLASCSFFKKESSPEDKTVRVDNPKAEALFINAKRWEAAGESKKALKDYRRLLSSFAADKRAAEARYREASILSARGDFRDSFQSYQKFIVRHPENSFYSQAVAEQEKVAHAAAEGSIKTNFLGLKSRLDRKEIIAMLSRVRDNAPRADSAPRAQYMIGQLNEARKKPNEAVGAYEKLLDDFPRASQAADSQFRIGEILLQQSRNGNQNQANLERARNAYNDLLLVYPNSEYSGQAKQRLTSIGSHDLQASYNVAEFYRKKGENESACFYYQEVVDGAGPSELRNRAAARLAELKG